VKDAEEIVPPVVIEHDDEVKVSAPLVADV